MIINHNMSAMYAQRNLKLNDVRLKTSESRLASGLRITKAADDASGLAVSEKLRAQIRGLNQAQTNAENGISFIQATEGYLEETQDVLHRIRELSIQAANGIYTEEDREMIQVEISQLVDELDRIASHAQFNGMNLLTGRFARDTGQNTITSSMWFHIGANMDQRERVYIQTMSSEGLGVRDNANKEFVSLETPDGANSAIGVIDSALKIVNKQRADLGAYQNRLEMAVKGIGIGAENMQAAESTIRDADMAKEVVSYTKDNILIQSATAMLAQANTKPQVMLQLLG
ncbi:MAG: flagellin [Spirochaetales bacterium]|nr:flagellin [Spirochaetales bacterium]